MIALVRAAQPDSHDERAVQSPPPRASKMEQDPASLIAVYLDPPTGKILWIEDYRSTFPGKVHASHANFFMPGPTGRQIVGALGICMLLMSLSGLFICWPRAIPFGAALRFRRGVMLPSNLHHFAGLLIAMRRPWGIEQTSAAGISDIAMVDDATGAVKPSAEPRAGDYVAQWICRIHTSNTTIYHNLPRQWAEV